MVSFVCARWRRFSFSIFVIVVIFSLLFFVFRILFELLKFHFFVSKWVRCAPPQQICHAENRIKIQMKPVIMLNIYVRAGRNCKWVCVCV